MFDVISYAHAGKGGGGEQGGMQTLTITDSAIESSMPLILSGSKIDPSKPVFLNVNNQNKQCIFEDSDSNYYTITSQVISIIGSGNSLGMQIKTDVVILNFKLSSWNEGYSAFFDSVETGTYLSTFRDSTDANQSQRRRYEEVVDGAKAHKLAADFGLWGSNIPDDALITAKGSAAIVYELWKGDGPCLIAGTKITMQDFSKKNIEDIKVGDIVKSWNPTTKELCDAVVLVSQKTGEEEHFTNHIFEDGNNLITFADHGYYNPMFRYVRNIKNEKKNFHVLNQDIKIKKCVVKTDYYVSGHKVGRYNIVTSNNLYFANEVLCGDSPFRKYSYYVKHEVQLPEVIEQVCKADSDAYNEWNSLLNNPTYLKESADARTRRVNAHEKELSARAELAALDYQTIKMAEGLVTNEEIADTLARKEELRAIVNEQHELFVAAFNEVKEIELKYRNRKYDALFRECCDRDNAAFEQFKNWLSSEKEENK